MRGAKETMSQYYAKGSRENVISHLRQLSMFCVAFKETFLPVSRYALLGFIELMSRTVGYDHIQHMLGSIKFLHDFTGHSYPGESFEFQVLLRGLKRKLAKPPKQALPITPEMLILMYAFVNISQPAQLAHWTSFVFALRFLYRKSSIAPTSLRAFDARIGLSRGKAVLSHGVVLIYQITQRHKLVSENYVQSTDPAFSFYENGTLKCVTHRSFTQFLKSLLVKIGLDPNDWTGHSFRRGGASLLYRLGCDPLTIQACGDWASDTFLRYLEVNFDRLWAAQLAMASFPISA